jgi:hypothetical protein
MKSFFNLKEQQEQPTTEKSVTFAFGRFQPPTAGHEVVFRKVKEVAKQKKSDHRIFFSRTDPSILAKKTKDSFEEKATRALQNPLHPDDKYKILTTLFPEHNFVNDPKVVTALDAMRHLGNAGYHHLTFVGEKPREDITTQMKKYIGHPDFPNVKSVEFVLSGERDPDAEGVEGISGTKVRAAAESGDHDAFHAMMPKNTHPDTSKNIMHTIRQSISRTKVAIDQMRSRKKPKQKKVTEEVYLGEQKELSLEIDLLLEKTKDPTRKERDHRMYGWGKSKPTPKQLANRKKKDKRTVARRKANESGRTQKGDKSVELDHKNGNANDNSSDNLRVVSRKFNRSRNNNKWRK